MNKRILAIVNHILESEQNPTLDELARQFMVSQRTIRNYISSMNQLLLEWGLSELKLKSGGVIEKKEDFKNVLSFLDLGDYYAYKLSRDERQMVAAAMLVDTVGYITLAAIADNLFVSRGTIVSDLGSIKKLLREGGLEVISHPNKGLKVEGKESGKRWFLFRVSAFGLDRMSGADYSGSRVSVQAGDSITVRKIINEQEHVHQCFLSDSSFLKMQKYLGIMISRNLQGEYIEPQEGVHHDKYIFAQDILKYVSQYCHITTTEHEVLYLSDLLKRCTYIKRKSLDTETVKIRMITRRFIWRISEELGVNLENDFDFYENLSNHMESMFISDSSNFPENPVLTEIVDENPEILGAVRSNLKVFLQYKERAVTRAEETYIAVHVCAALERKKNSEIAFHVVVACHGGIGTSQLMMEKLKKHFNFQIVDIISSHDVAAVTEEKADLIISTIPLTGCRIEYVIVNPMLNDEDYIRVGNKIDALRNSRNLPDRMEARKVTAKGVLERIGPILREGVPDKSERLMQDIRREIRSYFNETQVSASEVFAPCLHQLLTAKSIQVDVECANWKEAIRKSAQPLLDKGYIEKRYIDSMVRNVEMNGPYIVVASGFAVPHEGVEMGAVKGGMNLIRLKKPVPFGLEAFDPVEFVCCLSTVDHKTYLKAFFNLVNLFRDSRFYEALHSAPGPEMIAAIITKYEYSLEK